MKRVQGILLFLPRIKQYCSVLTLLLLVALKAVGQGAVLSHSYNFSKSVYTVYELTTLMQQQADVSISYDSGKIKSKTKIRLPKSSMTTKELVVLLNKNYHIQAKFIGKHIILQKEVKVLARHKAQKKKAKKRMFVAKKPVKEKVGNTAPLTPVKVVPVLPVATLDTISDFTDTFTVNSQAISVYTWTTAPATEAVSIDSHTNRLDDPEITSFHSLWYQQFGLSFNVAGDEVFYLNPGLSLHWSNLSISGNYAIRGDLSHFRFGLSYTQPLTEQLSIDVWANYGMIPNQPKVLNYQYDSIIDPDSLVVPVSGNLAYKINGTLWKAGINLDWQLGTRLELFSGISFNRSRTQILFNNEVQAPRTFIPASVPIDAENFSLFPRILNLSEDFSPNSGTYTRFWVGFGLGLRLYLFRSRD